MKIFPIILSGMMMFSSNVNAQYAASKDAQYLAVVKAVANYKIDDEEELDQVQKLRESERFNQTLRKMLSKLSNKRNKDAKNREVLQILKRTGKELYDLLK